MSASDRRSPGGLGSLDLVGADAALLRDAQRARRETAATGRTVVVFKDGESAWLTIHATQYEDEGEEIHAHEKCGVESPESRPPPGSRYR